MYVVVCPRDVQGGIAWPRTIQGLVAEVPCSQAGPFYRMGAVARRGCNEMGEWETADFSSCTLDDSASEPFLLLWLVVQTDEDDIEEETQTLEEEVILTTA